MALSGIAMITRLTLFVHGNIEDGIDPEKLCEDIFFRLYVGFPIAICFVFGFIWKNIHKQVYDKKRPMVSQFDRKVLNLQRKRLNELKNSILLFFISNIILVVLNILMEIFTEEDHLPGHNCNTALLYHKFSFYNAFVFLVTRYCSCFTA
jgi:hypothetical protein